MLPEQQQRILGYFLEEARDHLNTIEQGLLNLQSTLDDPEMINEVFRAAHSIKGGAAMLGLSSIQHTSHRLEDCFKLLKDNPVKIDEKLETLFLGVSDTLKVLLENLGGPFGLSEDAANTLMAQTEPVFQGLHQHLELLVQQGGDFATPEVATKPEPVLVNAATSSSSKPKQTLQPIAKGAETRTPSTATAVHDQRGEFQNQVLQILREMLQLFKQTTTPSTRQNLEQCCHKLVKLGEGLDLPNWCNLCTAAGSAIANPDNTYLILAKIVITEIKQAQELVLKGRESEITISQQLKAIISLPEIEELEITPDFVNEQPQAVTESTETSTPVTADLQPQNAMTDLFEIQEEDNSNVDDGLRLPSSEQLQVTPANAITPINFAANSLFDHEDEALLTKSSIDPHGPEVGIAELNTLADLFEGESPELEDSWHQEETIDIISTNSLGTEDSDVENVDHDLDDFLFDDNISNNERPTATNSTEDLTLLFGDENFLDNENSESQNQLTDASTAEVSNISLSDTDLLSSPVNILGEFTESSSDFQPYPQEAAPTISINDVDENSLVLSSEIGDLFNEPEITAAKVSTAEEELNRFWNQTEETPLLQLDSGANEQDVARELEENLFAAAVSEDIFADSQQSIPSSVASFDIEDFDISVPQPEQSLDLRLVSDAENNLFEDLEAANSTISPAIIDSSEVSLQEIHSFSQEPEAVDFMPEFANQPLEATATGSPNTFAEMAIDLFETVDDSSEENLSLSEEVAARDSTYIQPFATDDLFGNLDDSSEENLSLPEEVAARDSTYIQPFATDDLFGNLDDSSEENLSLSGEEVAARDSTYIQPFATDDLFGNLDDSSEENLSLPGEDAFEFTEITVAETAQLSLVDDLLETETALAEVTSQEELVVNTVSDLPAIDEFINIPTQEDEFNLEIEQNLQGDLSEDLLDIGEINQAASVIGEESIIVIPTEKLEVETAIDVAPQDDSSVLNEFAELEALLGDELAPVVNTAAIPEEDFAALEALLGSDNDEAVAMPSEKPQSETQPVLAQTHNVVSSPVIDEFDDLEKLLAEADQTISHSPPTKSNTPRTARSSTRRAARFEETMKVPVKQLDDMSNLVGELVVNRNTLEQDHERLRQSLDNLLIQVQQLSDVGARMQELYERSLLEASLLASRKPKEIGIPIPDSNTDRGFSELEMDRFTPFHTLSQEMIEFIVRVRESASDIDFVTEETERVARQFRQVTTQLQEGLTRARMVPFAQAVDSKRRGVRDNAIKCGKQVELVIEGGDTLIDKMILDHLTDPLTHMLNNAIAHGIETPDVRIAAGKSPVGYITIRAFHQGNQTVISVGDDGAGINSEQVKAKAVRIGLITPEQAKTISRLEIYDLLFQPGFSMKDKADEMSGRGVGMDVVRSQISEIRGIVNTDSVIGKGTNFTIRLPLTLSICKALCCVSDKARIAFPMDGVEDTLDIPVKNIQQDADGQSFIYWRDTVLPFRPLKELLTFNRQLSRGNVYGGTRDDDMVSVVVVRSANTLVALQVDQVLSEQEIVIKQFEGPAPKPSGVAGATVLGDGRIMPIADVLEIIDIFQGNMSKQTRSSTWQNKVPPPAAAAKIDPTVLIVDDSITVRELLSLTFNKAGYRVEQARDGQEAWDKLRSGLPCDIVFCDIEMPRCDGLELLSRIQKDPNLNHLPIAMLTSRGADKHRQMAIQFGASGYFTKPYLEEALLEAASRMLKGEKLVTTV